MGGQDPFSVEPSDIGNDKAIAWTPAVNAIAKPNLFLCDPSDLRTTNVDVDGDNQPINIPPPHAMMFMHDTFELDAFRASTAADRAIATTIYPMTRPTSASSTASGTCAL
ncbi:MAG: hypothetical protein Q8O67_33635 [Deltaproteobacteria bacterium]|nr:hypothetical protein [Deltaproteobacteria bacterium]